MNTPTLRATQQPWYRADLLRGCKTGEVVEPIVRTRAQKLRAVAIALAFGAPAVLASQWFFKTWVPRYYVELETLAKIDAVESARKWAEFTSLLLLMPVLISVGAAVWSAVALSRIVRAGRSPLPGAKVFRRAEVIVGWCARLPALLLGLLLLACMLVVWWSYVRVLVLFWDGYLDRQVEVSSKSQLHISASKGADVRSLNAIGVRP